MVGNYDGIHLGHQAIINQAKELARSHNLKTAVLSFEPHPLKVLAPSRAPKLLHTLEQKRLLLDFYQVDYYVEQQFDEAFSKLSPEAFILHLRARIPFRFILVGFNFHFGHQRAGDFQTLETMGQRFGFQAIKQAAVNDESGPVSSSRIRALIKEGKTLEAARLLNRPYFLDGVVVPGAQIGRKLESPTANFVAANQLLPRFGVYASWARAEKNGTGLSPMWERHQRWTAVNLLSKPSYLIFLGNSITNIWWFVWASSSGPRPVLPIPNS